MKQRAAVLRGYRVAVAIVILFPTAVHGATRYVRTDGNNSNTGLANTSGGAWRTITAAANLVSPGDVVRVQAGTYSERVAVGVSGTAGNPITFVADGAVTFCGMDISSKNYLRIIGFTIDTDAGTCSKSNRALDVSGTNTGLEFWNNTIRDARNVGIGAGSYADRHHNFVIIGNTFTAIGGGGGNGTAVSIIGNNNLLAYNDISGLDPDAFYCYGQNNRWLNNYIHNVLDTADLHSDVFQANSHTLGLSNNLFEANFAVGAGNLPNEHGALLQNQGGAPCENGPCGAITENLFRYNVWFNQSGGVIGVDQVQVGPITNTRQVHDTVVDAMRNAASVAYGVVLNGSGITAWLRNNLYYRAWGSSVASNVQVFATEAGASISGADYNLAFTPDNTPTYAAPWTAQANPRSNVNPSFVGYTNQNFTLAATSGARGTGAPLTTVSGSGNGTTFNVATGGGGFFRGPNASVSQYGGNLTAGDVITVGTNTVTVASVSGDAITVTSSFTWANGDAVFLGATATPDVGAYPYKTGGYNLSAIYSLASGTVTVTPSDTSLVRFVVCYEDGVPTRVVNSSPYLCSVGTGSLDVRVYPRYASKTLFVPATTGLTPPPNLRVVPSQ
jgi:hypothetical protein